MKPLKIAFFSLSCLFMMACSTQNSPNENEELIVPDSIVAPESIDVSKESMDDLIDNVSSPIEIASLLLEEKVPFNKSLIITTNHIDDLVTDFDCALNLGLLGTDLGYLNLYEKTSSVMSTVSAINDITNKLKVGQFFDFDLLKRLSKSSDNLDSLIFTSIASFNNMDDYLRSNNRTNISALIVSGVWLESTHLATSVYAKHNNQKIAERIGEQKLILNNLILILENYQSDNRFASLLGDFNRLKILFDQVSIVSTDAEPESIVKDGMLVIVQNSVSTVNITDELISEIGKEVALIRNKLIIKA
jgi:hypothetical protein